MFCQYCQWQKWCYCLKCKRNLCQFCEKRIRGMCISCVNKNANEP